jgi:hypothetical protein
LKDVSDAELGAHRVYVAMEELGMIGAKGFEPRGLPLEESGC